MNAEPARLVRVTGFNGELFALDKNGALWSFEQQKYQMVWTALPKRPGIIDLYVHVSIDPWESVHHSLRVLDDEGKLWELRWIGRGEYLWDAISLEAR